ncbi:MAG: maleylacetoacetate isomerase [Alphaproteobacteria bacterium]|nr:maleylacetoacetate isomerase [Alphaproteobacteria bacterium]MDE2110412.1 maleylacetoacetate isomerase [Alphaproteobacteria bacterium]MDE2493429.1 maleylacetoacetate isomerase [Alphaproteobacteria bacterium]
MMLYTYFRSSAAFRVRIALNLKGLKPEQVFVHLRKQEQAADKYRELNPQALLPTLVHEGHAIGQSLAIIEYLDELVREPPLLPHDPLGRARVRQIAYAVACEMHPLGNMRVQNYLRDTLGHSEAEVLAWHRYWLALGLEAVEKMVAAPHSGKLCHGDDPTLADICLIPQMANARRIELSLSPYPTLLKIERIAYKIAAFDEAQPKKQPDAE